MRIISGLYKGRKIFEPTDNLTRPLKDLVRESIFNILEHSYVPKHRVMSEEEQNELFERLNITSSEELPEISRFDPVAKAIGLRPGQLCHIERKSPTAFKTDFYRYCVA